MAANKIVYGTTVLIDLTADTVTADKILASYTAHDQSGVIITGTCDFDVNSGDATVKVAEMLEGKTAYARGAKLTGTMPNRGAVNLTIDTVNGEVTVAQGYHDGGGKVIRSHITEAIPKDRLIQLYVPQIKGRERRKTENSAEGYLGVEGMEASVLRDLLSPFATEGGVQRAPITKLDFYEQGLTGAKNSSERRDRLAQKLGLPKKMTANALLEAVRIICTAERFFELCGEI